MNIETQIEEFKPIKGYEGLYQISNLQIISRAENMNKSINKQDIINALNNL